MKWLLLIFLTINSVDLQAQKFEGKIIYDIEYTPKEQGVSESQLQHSIGSKMILYYKKGNSRKEFYDPNGKLLQTRITNLESGKSRALKPNTDTILWFDVTKNDSRGYFEVLGDTIINGAKSKQINSVAVVGGYELNGQSVSIITKFNYSSALKVNPRWFKNYLEGDFNKLIKLGKAISVETSSSGPFFVKIIKAKIIERQSLDDQLFKVDTTGKFLLEL